MRSTFKHVLATGPCMQIRRRLNRLLQKRMRVLIGGLVLSLLIASLPVSAGTPRGLPSPPQSVSAQISAYTTVKQAWSAVAGWLTSHLTAKPRHDSYQPVTAYYTPPFITAPTDLTVTATVNNSIQLSWIPPSGVHHYDIERSNSISGQFVYIGTTTGTTYPDTSVIPQHAYLYRVRAVTSGGLTSTPSNMALGTAITFEFASLSGKEIKKQHFYDVRNATNAVRAVANRPATSWAPRDNLTNLEIKADDVQQIRNALDEALSYLSIPVTAYADATLATGSNGTPIRAIHIEQLQTRSSRGKSTSYGPLEQDSSSARLDPMNETGGGGENPLSRNFNWNLSLVNLPGRAGMNLDLTLSYNSLVWTKIGSSTISFNDDRGFPGPGFRLGFPVIQPSYFNAQVGKNAFMLIGSDGRHTELRQVATGSVFYESADSSHLLLDITDLTSADPKMLLKMTDGTQLTYKPKGVDYECTEIKDRNGNYITINYNAAGDIDNIHDTLDRVITFNYDSGWLSSITQVWKKPSNPAQTITHTWASFSYADLEIQTDFTGLSIVGATNGQMKKVLTRVTLDDNSTTASQNSHFDFEYTPWGQVWKISNFAADNHLLNYRSYKLPDSPLWDDPPAQTECPRFTERRQWAENWNRLNETGAEQEATTTFTGLQNGTANVPGQSPQSAPFVQVTNPDGTFSRIYFLTTAGWRVGLPYLVDSYDVASTTPQRQAVTTWEQDDEGLSYLLNPRIKETNVYDPSGNRRRVSATYQQFTPPNGGSYKLSGDILEYATDGTTVLRSTRTDYVDGDSAINEPYLTRRIFGLVKEKKLYNGNVNSGGTLKSRVGFSYDESESIEGADTPVQHDISYDADLVSGRGNLSTVKRYDVDDDNNALFTASTMKYNTAGAVVSAKDALLHEVKIEYADAFSDGVSRTTLAYPTKVTDPNNYFSKSWYNYDFGEVTKTRTPPANVTGTQSESAGPETTFAYDDLGRLERTTNNVNSAYRRFEYDQNGSRIDAYATIQEDEGEARSFQIADGLGHVIANASVFPLSTGDNYSGQIIGYDVMGRVTRTSNPTETTAVGNNPTAWATAGDDQSTGWLYTRQTYDWKGRPLITTNPDSTTKSFSYTGCGCAGGEVVTVTDEGTLVNGANKTRQQKLYSDVLGRTVKVEVWDFEGSAPDGVSRKLYSTAVTTYNVLDQAELVREFKGAATADLSCPTGDCQHTDLTYDGYGRLKTKHTPKQKVNKATTYNYNADDSISSVVDARGVTTNFVYNARQLLTAINFQSQNLPTGVNPATNVSYGYDAAGNRISMSDAAGSLTYEYDMLYRLTSETRQFNQFGATQLGPLSLSYEYSLAGKLKKLTIGPANTVVNYTLDKIGRVKSVTGEGFEDWGGVPVPTLASNIKYRASGELKHLDYGNTLSLDMTYDNRGRVTSYEIPNFLKLNYSYHSDGKIKYSQSVTDDRDDRSYVYDHAGRLKEAKSGAQARGLSQMTGPYHETFGFDVWSNLTNRDTEHWHDPGGQYSFSTTYENNRREGWQYDDEGNILNGDDVTRHINAAGLNVLTEGNGNTNGYVYDGDGQIAVDTNGQQVAGWYRFKSTVLGGLVVLELNNFSQTNAKAYLDGRLLASVYDYQVGSPNQKGVTWHHADASGTTLGTSFSPITAAWKIRTELDPMGANVGIENPYFGEPPYESPNPTRFEMASPEAVERCELDGILVQCGAFMLGTGWAVPCPNNQCNKTTDRGLEFFHAYADGRSGYLPVGVNWTGDGFTFPGGKITFPDGIPRSLLQSSAEADRIVRAIDWAKAQVKKLYEKCLEKLGKQTAPGTSQAEDILSVSSIEGIDSTLLAVTWGEEGTFSPNPVANYRGDNKIDGGWDVGPGQISTTYYNKAPFTTGLPNAFGSGFSETVAFNGDTFQNLRATARAYTMDIFKRSNSRADAAGLFRAGGRQRIDKKTGKMGPDSRYVRRSNNFTSLAPAYDAFFNCLKDGTHP